MSWRIERSISQTSSDAVEKLTVWVERREIELVAFMAAGNAIMTLDMYKLCSHGQKLGLKPGQKLAEGSLVYESKEQSNWRRFAAEVGRTTAARKWVDNVVDNFSLKIQSASFFTSINLLLWRKMC